MDTLRIAIWNANGLLQSLQELKVFLHTNKIDVLLIAETHFTVKSFVKISLCNVYDSKYPSGRAHGGPAIIIKQDNKYFFQYLFADVHIQATTVLSH